MGSPRYLRLAALVVAAALPLTSPAAAQSPAVAPAATEQSAAGAAPTTGAPSTAAAVAPAPAPLPTVTPSPTIAPPPVVASCAALAANQSTYERALALATCEERAGRSASAWSALQVAVVLARREGRDALVKPLEQQSERLERRLVKLRIERGTDILQDGVLVMRDGVGLPSTDLERDIPVDPGTHVIIVAAPDKLSWSTTVDARAPGRTYQVKYPLLPDAVPTPGAAEARRTRAFLEGLAACGLAVIGFSAGISLTATALEEADARKSFTCSDTPEVCKKARDVLPDSQGTLVGAGFGYGLGAVGTGLAIALFLRAQEPSKPLAPATTAAPRVSFVVAPWLAPTGGGVGLTGRF